MILTNREAQKTRRCRRAFCLHDFIVLRAKIPVRVLLLCVQG